MLRVTPNIHIPVGEFVFTFVRSSGPGGQNVNKVNSKAVMHWHMESSPHLPRDVKERLREQFKSRFNGEGYFVLSSDRFRDQRRNKDDCLEKLLEILIQVATPPIIRKDTKPTRSSVRRRVESKGRRAEVKRQRSRIKF